MKTYPSEIRALIKTATQIIAAIWIVLWPSIAKPLDSDRLQPIQIEADSAELDDAKGTAIYSGKVKLVQGTIVITADKLTIYQGENGVAKAVAEGDVARYEQQLELNKPKIIASARQINYRTQEQMMELLDKALITQGEHRFEGDKIEYDISRQKLSASSSNTERVKMTLPAASLNKDADSSDNTVEQIP